MQKITTHLWYDKEAKEAAEFYVSVFSNGSRVMDVHQLDNTPSGSVDIVTFEIWGREFQAISAGPLFKFNPSISFQAICQTKDEVDLIWNKLVPGGMTLMELGSYPFSERFGWLMDKYGLSWQIMYLGGPEVKHKITPFIMFVGDVCGKAEEAINFWKSVFRDAQIRNITRYGKGEEPDKEGTVKQAYFSLLGREFGAMDSAHEHKFAFNEAISFIVKCDNQQEIDNFWNKLSADPNAEQCGWLKDKYGLSWQVVPAAMDAMLKGGDKTRIARVTEAFLKMKKFDIAALERAYEGG